MKNFMKLSFLFLLLCALLSGCITQEATPVSSEVTPEETETPATEPVAEHTLSPAHTDATNPQNWDIRWEILENGEYVESFQRKDPISFGSADEYFPFQGVSTFRGNNYRNNPCYGNVVVDDETLDIKWEHTIGRMGEWSGCGWSGQPLIVRWEEGTKQIMNIFPEKKSKKDLVEVIYATMDGNIYFYDLDDGESTRDKLNVGMTFKGTGTLDPRGYPIMYIGSGIASGGKNQRMYAIDLINNEVIYEQGGDDPDALRNWAAFDSSPIIDAETDTLIWPGENGVLYTIKLNTDYDPKNKSIRIQPENLAKCRYGSKLTDQGRWHGFESSCVAVDSYVYVTDNTGMMYCIDLNTMELLWAQDIWDDSNSSPLFAWEEDGSASIYAAPALRWTAEGGAGSTTIFKLDANTGETLWKVPYKCKRQGENSGGVQSSPAIGKKGSDMENMILYNIAATPSTFEGILVALDQKTGEVIWEHKMPNYTWSSPAIVYTEDGKGYVLICDSVGDVKLLNGADGTFLDTVNIGSNVEASPAIFENTLVVGTRGSKIYGIAIK